MTRGSWPFVGRLHFVASIMTVLFVRAATPCHAQFVLGTAANYGVLVGSNAHNFQFNNSTIAGSVGIGAGINDVQIASNGFINDRVAGDPTTGQLQIVDPSVTVSNPGNVQGGVLFSQTQVTTAYNTVTALSTSLAATAGNALTISGGGQIVNVTSGNLVGGNFVFALTSSAFNNDNAGFTINGTASQYVVFNINNGVSNEALGGPISLSGGITPDHVLFNFVGTSGNLGASAGGATVNGIILAPNMKVNLDNMTLNGRIFGGRSGQDFQLVSGFHLVSPLASVPEPSSLVLAGLAGCVLGARALWRRRVPRAA